MILGSIDSRVTSMLAVCENGFSNAVGLLVHVLIVCVCVCVCVDSGGRSIRFSSSKLTVLLLLTLIPHTLPATFSFLFSYSLRNCFLPGICVYILV